MKAFPHQGMGIFGNQQMEQVWDKGMDLRDYFAAKAMPLFLHDYQKDKGQWNAESIAEDSYFLADAMMKARERK